MSKESLVPSARKASGCRVPVRSEAVPGHGGAIDRYGVLAAAVEGSKPRSNAELF